MAEQKVLIFDGALSPNTQNYSAFFGTADYLYVTSTSVPDWSVTGDFIEIDCDLLITVEAGVKRRVPLSSGYASTRELIRIPQEFTRSGCLLELIMQASFSASIKVWAVSVESESDVISRIEAILTLLDALLGLLGAAPGGASVFTILDAITALIGTSSNPALPSIQEQLDQLPAALAAALFPIDAGTIP